MQGIIFKNTDFIIIANSFSFDQLGRSRKQQADYRQTAGRQTHNTTPGVINIISCLHCQRFIELGQHYDKSEF